MSHPETLSDRRPPTQLACAARAADLSPLERHEALRNITLRRDTLVRGLAQLDALEAGHRAALTEGPA
ncbi:hypothetical protein HNQ07_000417 [Deinococcus metalli]|uniref:Uncharacterized protein n=1 Tax=Deinococcus metalli TaxID=1141878 RepID=A0A7W8NPM0_9DEIO|nr:hypothetical protein [Deinococcus metalli]MBB5374973.1 hypothetical protein [Deinococcus metalli]